MAVSDELLSRLPAATGEQTPARTGLTASRLFAPLAGLALLLAALTVSVILFAALPQQPVLFAVLQAMLFLTGVFLLGLILYRIDRNLLEPLAHLRLWAQQVRAGRLSARIPVPGGGEFAELARDVNQLGETLEMLSRDFDAEVARQTERIAQKNRSLEVLYDVAASVNVSRDLEDLLNRFLHTMKDVVQARAASVCLLDQEGTVRTVASIGADHARIPVEQLVQNSQVLEPNTLTQGEALYQERVVDLGAAFTELFADAERIALITVPLHYRGSTLGLYNLFVERDGPHRREDVQALLTSIGRHLGMAIEKAQMEQEARYLGIMQERTMLAHELHDSLAQTLASLRFQVRVLDETLQQSGNYTAIAGIEQVENSLDEAHAELRELIAHFRAPMDARGLIPAIEKQVTRFRSQTGIAIFLQKSGWENTVLPAHIEMHVLRIVQEALANIRKHSEATHVRIMLRRDREQQHMVLVEDDGVGLGAPLSDTPPGEHIGLTIMQERARHLGGELRIESEPGEGTTVVLTFHYERPPAAPALRH